MFKEEEDGLRQVQQSGQHTATIRESIFVTIHHVSTMPLSGFLFSMPLHSTHTVVPSVSKKSSPTKDDEPEN